jgi:hypothetical protein
LPLTSTTRKLKRKYAISLLSPVYLVYPDWSLARLKKKADAWALQNWLHDAQQRTEEYHRNGSQSSVTWILTHGKRIPPGAIKGGHDQGHTLYIARAFQDVSCPVSCIENDR